MNRGIRLLFTLGLLLIGTLRLPAPIQEAPESPTPTPEQPAKPKPKRPARSNVAGERAESSVPQQMRTPVPIATPNQNRFDGAWVGTLNNLPFAGNVEFTLLVTDNGMSVTEKSTNFGTHTFQVNCDGSTMRWETGSSWTLTPNPDGQTALITCNNAGFFGVGAFSLSTVFRKTAVAQTPNAVATRVRDTIPVAKPVPNKPGFVYNPFEPNSPMLLDIRGKASGAKVKDPFSGKLFIVP